MMTRGLLSTLATALVVLAFGCAPTGVGDPCTLEVEPEGGFLDNDTAVETSSIQCRTRACLVFHSQSFCSHRCETDNDCQAEWHESGPGQGDEDPAYCEAQINIGAPNVVGRYCVPAYASEEH